MTLFIPDLQCFPNNLWKVQILRKFPHVHFFLYGSAIYSWSLLDRNTQLDINPWEDFPSYQLINCNTQYVERDFLYLKFGIPIGSSWTMELVISKKNARLIISELLCRALVISDTVIITVVFTFPHHMLGLLFKSVSCGLVLKNNPWCSNLRA